MRAFGEQLRVAPGAGVTVPVEGVPVRLGVDGPEVGRIDAAAVDEQGRVVVRGVLDGAGFEGVAGVATFTPQAEVDLPDLDDVVHRPLPLPEGWRW